MKLLIKALQKGSLIMAVRAPRPTHSNNNYLPIKLRIGVRNYFAIQVWKAESKALTGILDGRLFGRFRRRRKVFLASLSRTPSHQIALLSLLRLRHQQVAHQQSP